MTQNKRNTKNDTTNHYYKLPLTTIIIITVTVTVTEIIHQVIK